MALPFLLDISLTSKPGAGLQEVPVLPPPLPSLDQKFGPATKSGCVGLGQMAPDSVCPGAKIPVL